MAKPRKPRTQAGSKTSGGAEGSPEEATVDTSDAKEAVAIDDQADTAATDTAKGDVEPAVVHTDPEAKSDDDTVTADPWRSDAKPKPVESVDAPEKVSDSVVGPVTPQPERRGVFWPLVLGGIAAASIGFVAGRADQLNAYLPTFLQRSGPDLSYLEARTQSLAEDAVSQATKIDALEAEIASAADQSVLTARLATLDQMVSEIQARLDEAEKVPVELMGDADEQMSALQTVINAQKVQISELSAAVEAIQSNSHEAAQRMLARAALTRVISAVDTGAPFATALGDLEETGLVEVPGDLAVAADAGLATLAMLQDRFPDASRRALSAARTGDADQADGGLTGFLKRQLSARSVTPREGSDPDAVLSRAEAAVRDGRLTDALAEIDTLPDAARAAMSEWIADAQARQAAQNAAESLAQSLTTN